VGRRSRAAQPITDSDSDSDSDDDAAVNEEVEITVEAGEEDEGQEAHNTQVARTLRGKAIQIMAAKNVRLDTGEDRMALQIFPRVRLFFLAYLDN